MYNLYNCVRWEGDIASRCEIQCVIRVIMFVCLVCCINHFRDARSNLRTSKTPAWPPHIKQLRPCCIWGLDYKLTNYSFRKPLGLIMLISRQRRDIQVIVFS